MHAVISRSYTVVITEKFQKRLSTLLKKTGKYAIYYSQVIAQVASVFRINSTRKAISSIEAIKSNKIRLILFQLCYSCYYS